MQSTGMAAASILLVILSTQTLAQDAQRGEVKAVDCVACHGAMGYSSNPLFPNLAGQNAGYLQLQLEKFQKGVRYHPLMTPVAQSLSQQDMDDLAAYYSSIAPLAETRQKSAR